LVFYTLLPYDAPYQPYSLDHVVTQMQLLLFAVLAVAVLIRTGIYPPELRSTNLDFDWVYRRLGRDAVDAFYALSNRAWAMLVAGAATGARSVNRQLHRHHGPEGVLGRTWPTGTMALWAILMLGAYLVLSYIGAPVR